VRGVDVRDTLLRRPFRLVSVSAIAAGLARKSGGTTLAPVLRRADVRELIRAVDPAAPDPSAPLTAHPSAARQRRLVRALPVPLAFLVLALVVTEPWAVAAALLLTAIATAIGVDRYRQLGHAFHGRRLAVRGGSLHRRWSEVDPAASAAYELRSSPFQRRAGLCTVWLHLGQGAGSRRVLDLGEQQAAHVLRVLDPHLLEPLLARD
jgi:putative membrane protein